MYDSLGSCYCFNEDLAPLIAKLIFLQVYVSDIRVDCDYLTNLSS